MCEQWRTIRNQEQKKSRAMARRGHHLIGDTRKNAKDDELIIQRMQERIYESKT